MKTIGRHDIDAFATQLRLQGKDGGILRGDSFSRFAIAEAQRLDREEGIAIILVKG